MLSLKNEQNETFLTQPLRVIVSEAGSRGAWVDFCHSGETAPSQEPG